MKYVIDFKDDVFVFESYLDHVDVVNRFVVWKDPVKSAGIVNICSGGLKVCSGSFTLGIPESPERTEQDRQTLTDHLTYL